MSLLLWRRFYAKQPENSKGKNFVYSSANADPGRIWSHFDTGIVPAKTERKTQRTLGDVS